MNRLSCKDENKVGMKFIQSLTILFGVIATVLFPCILYAEEYTFDISEIEKKPYHIGGNIELKPILFGLDKNASLYKLKFYNRAEGNTIEEYDAKLQLEGSLEKGITKLFVKTNTDYKKSYLGEDQQTTIYKGFLSVKPSSSLSIDVGKKTLRWGKGYTWNPIAFIDRPKDPDDPELNLAGKLYLLFYDTDIDVMILSGGSKTTRYGVDFSRNITTNFEIHGEFAVIDDYKKRFIDES